MAEIVAIRELIDTSSRGHPIVKIPCGIQLLLGGINETSNEDRKSISIDPSLAAEAKVEVGHHAIHTRFALRTQDN